MKNILCYGDSNTWGFIPGSMNLDIMLGSRLQQYERWPMILNRLLGVDEYHIIEAGLNGRTTALDETFISRASRNGLSALPSIIEMHYPLDLVVLMLGTNDCKTEYNSTALSITDNMSKLIDLIQQSHFGINFHAPEILLVCPAPLKQVDIPVFTQFFNSHSIETSQVLSQHFAKLAAEKKCLYLDAGEVVKSSDVDGVHIDKVNQLALAEAIKNLLVKR